MRVTETAHWLEWQDWADPILQANPPGPGRQLHIPDRPGHGDRGGRGGRGPLRVLRLVRGMSVLRRR